MADAILRGLSTSTITTANLHVEVLPARLRIVRIAPDALHLYMRAIYDIAFLQPRSAVFSFTFVPGEVSLIINERFLHCFHRDFPSAEPKEASASPSTTADILAACPKDGSISISPASWFAMQIFSGPSGFDVSGGISLLSSILAAKDISLLNLSAFDSDLLLVRESDLEKAISVIGDMLTKIPSDSKKEVEEIVQTELSKVADKISMKTIFKSFESTKISHLSDSILIAGLNRDLYTGLSHVLARLMFYNFERHFFSLTVTDSEVSLFIDASQEYLFADAMLTIDRRVWKALKLDVPLGIDFDVCGIVSAMCAPLSISGKSFLNVSTFTTDFALVIESDFKEAEEILQSKESIKLA